MPLAMHVTGLVGKVQRRLCRILESSMGSRYSSGAERCQQGSSYQGYVVFDLVWYERTRGQGWAFWVAFGGAWSLKEKSCMWDG